MTPRTLYRFIDDGQLPAYRFGRVIRLKEDEVEEFIERCRIEPGTLDIAPNPSTNPAPNPSDGSVAERNRRASDAVKGAQTPT